MKMKNLLAVASFAILTSFFSQTVLYGMEQPSKEQESWDIATIREKLGEASEDIINKYITKQFQLSEAFDALYFLGGTSLYSNVDQAFQKPISAIASNDNGIVVGHEDGSITIFPYKPQKLSALAYKNPQKENMKGISGPLLATRIAAIASNNNGTLFGGSDGTIKILSVADDKISWDSIEEAAGITSAAIYNNYALIGLSNNTATFWDLAKKEKLLTLPHNASVTSVALADSAIITGSADDTVTIWDWQGQEPFPINTEQMGGASSIATDGEILAVGGLRVPAIAILDIKTKKQIFFGKDPDNDQGSVAVAIKNGILAVGFTNENVHLYDIKNHKMMKGIDTACPVSQVTASDNFIALLCGDTKSGDTKKVVKIYPRWSVERTPATNPYLWILENASIGQLRLINGLYKWRILNESFTVTKADAELFKTFPEHVQSYLKDAFNLKK